MVNLSSLNLIWEEFEEELQKELEAFIRKGCGPVSYTHLFLTAALYGGLLYGRCREL